MNCWHVFVLVSYRDFSIILKCKYVRLVLGIALLLQGTIFELNKLCRQFGSVSAFASMNHGFQVTAFLRFISGNVSHNATDSKSSCVFPATLHFMSCPLATFATKFVKLIVISSFVRTPFELHQHVHMRDLSSLNLRGKRKQKVKNIFSVHQSYCSCKQQFIFALQRVDFYQFQSYQHMYAL